MKKTAENIFIVTFGGFILITTIIMLGVTMVTPDVWGVNTTNVLTKVNITNTAPSIYSVDITPSSIDLSPGTTTTINCTGSIYDTNGWDDITTVNASLYDITVGDGSTTDNNYRYINTSCASSCTSISSTNASCVCLFQIEYYSNNGSWQCNMTAADAFGVSDIENSSYAAINTILALDVPSEIDFGNLSITETSTDKQQNITNYGNLPINISVRGYGQNDGDNVSMVCAQNNISIDLERYSIINNTNFADMTKISNTTTQVSNLTIPVRTNDTVIENDRNFTYWKIQIPVGAAGFCNGTVVFSAVDAS